MAMTWLHMLVPAGLTTQAERRQKWLLRTARNSDSLCSCPHLVQVLAMAESCEGPAPEPDALRALLAEPGHYLARLSRDLFATPAATAATLEACAATACCFTAPLV